MIPKQPTRAYLGRLGQLRHALGVGHRVLALLDDGDDRLVGQRGAVIQSGALQVAPSWAAVYKGFATSTRTLVMLLANWPSGCSVIMS